MRTSDIRSIGSSGHCSVVPAEVHGWVSKNGYKLEFDGNSEAIDGSDGNRYLLSGGKVSMISGNTEEK